MQIQIKISIEMFDEMTVAKKFRQSKQNKKWKEKKRKTLYNNSTKKEMINDDDDIDDCWFWLEKQTEIDKNQFAAVAKVKTF